MHVLRPSLTLSLTPELYRFIEGATASGAFASAEEVVHAALVRMAADAPETFALAKAPDAVAPSIKR
jgi:Arc/MetJ-type ribon-helix-helix transcriptional regulator